MVSITEKGSTSRSALASGRVRIPEQAYLLLVPDSDDDRARSGSRRTNKKGDVLTVAQLAGIMGAKRTSDLIPLCHPINLTNVQVDLSVHAREEGGGGGAAAAGAEAGGVVGNVKKAYYINVEALSECQGSTGVEMEALTAVSVACLTVWDMLKAVAGKEMVIEDIKVVKKTGGKSGDWVREEERETDGGR